MIEQIKVCSLKPWWEHINNWRHLLRSLLLNLSILCVFYFQTKNNFLGGLDFFSLLVIYIIIWCILMSFSLVNDIVVSTNNAGIFEQVFMSSCGITTYTFIQIVQKNICSIGFITVLITIVNGITKSFSFELIVSFFLTLLVGSFSILGVGYIISAIAMSINFSNISMLLRLIFLLIIVKCENGIFIPFVQCKMLLTDLILNYSYLWEQNPKSILILFINSFIYIVIGILTFSIVTAKQIRINADY